MKLKTIPKPKGKAKPDSKKLVSHTTKLYDGVRGSFGRVCGGSDIRRNLGAIKSHRRAGTSMSDKSRLLAFIKKAYWNPGYCHRYFPCQLAKSHLGFL